MQRKRKIKFRVGYTKLSLIIVMQFQLELSEGDYCFFYANLDSDWPTNKTIPIDGWDADEVFEDINFN